MLYMYNEELLEEEKISALASCVNDKRISKVNTTIEY